MSDRSSTEPIGDVRHRDEDVSTTTSDEPQSEDMMDASEVATMLISTDHPTSILEIPDYSIRIVVDVRSVYRMDQCNKSKIYEFLTKLSIMLRRNNIAMNRIEFYIADHLCSPTFDFSDKLRDHLRNRRLVPDLKSTLDGFANLDSSNLWYIITSCFKKMKLHVEFPVKLKKTVILDFGKSVHNQDKNLPNHKVVKCYASKGLPILPEIVEILTGDNQSTSSSDNIIQQSPQQHALEYNQACQDFEDEVASRGYDDVDFLGGGSYGTVNKYTNRAGKCFAVKFQPLNHETRKIIENELQIFNILEGNSFLSVVPYDTRRTNVMVAQTFHTYDKGSLYTFLQHHHHRINENQKENIMADLAQGLAWLHNQNVLHLDLKPCNILIDDSLRPTISDYGCSTRGPEAVLDCARGTKGYGSPETWISKVVNGKSDTFSMGMVYVYLWNNRPLLSKRQNKYRYHEEFWARWVPMVNCGRWGPLVEQMLSVRNDSRPTAESVLEQMRNVRQAEYYPFYINDSHRLGVRPTITYAFSSFAKIDACAEMTAELFANAVQRLADCCGASSIKHKITDKIIKFKLSKSPPPPNTHYKYEYPTKKKIEVKLFFGVKKVTHYEVKTHFWSLAQKILIELAKKTGMYENVDESELSSKLTNFLSLH